uniref:Uncharacterized protein n=4 Tax=Rhodnius TaxID=13248 RepID=T1HZK6_RHOPR
MKLDNEVLALMVATEWEAQREEIQLSSMHLTALCNTALENPNNVVKEEAVEKLVNYLETDTVLYYSHSEDVFTLQQREWDPVISWFCKKYDVDIGPTTDLTGPVVSNETRDIIRKHLLSYNIKAIHGFNLAVESLKSILLTLCCVERRITVDKAVLLSRLEEEYQAGRWGRVEWAHDMSQSDLQSRVAAGIIFVQINSNKGETKSKNIFKKTRK